jgi:hypothetical protein
MPGIVWFLVLASAVLAQGSKTGEFRITERQIGKLDGFNQSSYGMWFSPDNRRFHTIIERAGKQVVYSERGESRAFDRIWLESFVYSPRSTRFAFVGSTGEGEVAVLDGVEGETYERISYRFEKRIRFSADDQHFAYVGSRGQQDYLVVDGRELGSFDAVEALTFAPDQQLAYAACRNGQCNVVYGPHRSKNYEGIGPGIAFSPDGRSWAYPATLKGRHYNIAEGASSFNFCCGNPPGGVGPIFSTDGRRILFFAQGGDQQLVDLDRKGSLRTQYFHAGERFFAPDLRTWATVEALDPGTVSQACRVAIGDRRWQINSRARCVVDFTPDGKHSVIRADSQNTHIDGNAIPSAHRLDQELSRPVEFSPDGSSYAYEAALMPLGQRSVIVRDGKEIHSFDFAIRSNGVSFSPDNRHVAYVVAHGPMKGAIAVDGQEAPTVYDFFPYRSRIVFDSPQSLHTIALRNGEVLIVQLSWTD